MHMRNLFDQYDQPENRLSHALAVCLHEDRVLLHDFLSSWIGIEPPRKSAELVVVEQSLPGEPPESEEEPLGSSSGNRAPSLVDYVFRVLSGRP